MYFVVLNDGNFFMTKSSYPEITPTHQLGYIFQLILLILPKNTFHCYENLNHRHEPTTKNHPFQTQIETENESVGFSLTLVVPSFQIINITPNVPKESTTTKS